MATNRDINPASKTLLPARRGTSPMIQIPRTLKPANVAATPDLTPQPTLDEGYECDIIMRIGEGVNGRYFVQWKGMSLAQDPGYIAVGEWEEKLAVGAVEKVKIQERVKGRLGKPKNAWVVKGWKPQGISAETFKVVARERSNEQGKTWVEEGKEVAEDPFAWQSAADVQNQFLAQLSEARNLLGDGADDAALVGTEGGIVDLAGRAAEAIAKLSQVVALGVEIDKKKEEENPPRFVSDATDFEMLLDGA